METDLEEPVAQGRLAVAAGVTQRVGRRDDPDAEVDGEPRALVVVGVAVQGGAVAAQNVLQVAVGQVAALGARHHHQAHLDNRIGRRAISATKKQSPSKQAKWLQKSHLTYKNLLKSSASQSNTVKPSET